MSFSKTHSIFDSTAQNPICESFRGAVVFGVHDASADPGFRHTFLRLRIDLRRSAEQIGRK
jgi:hypothetical protein